MSEQTVSRPISQVPPVDVPPAGVPIVNARSIRSKLDYLRRLFRSDTLLKRLLIPYLLTCLFVGGTTLYNIYSINLIVNRLTATYAGNAQIFDLNASIKGVMSSLESYLSTRSSTALENYYRETESLSEKAAALNGEILDTRPLLLQRTIRRMIGTFLEESNQAIAAKRGRDVAAYTEHYESALRIFLYVQDYSDQLNEDRFQVNYSEYIRMEQQLKQIRLFDLAVMALILGLNFITVLLTAVRISRPIKTIARRADQLAGGDLNVRPISVDSHDEIQVLASAFNSMTTSLRAYVAETRDNLIRERQQKEHELVMENLLQVAQLKNLQAQINPHFLFNALNTAAQIAMFDNADRTAEFVEHVAAFYRYNLKLFERDVTLADEVRMVKDYIYIQKVRFTDRITYVTDIDPACLGLQMPGLILQPLVENAVLHGLKDVERNGRIEIVIREANPEEIAGAASPLPPAFVTILIRDNGRGMDPEKIAQVLQTTGPDLGSTLQAGKAIGPASFSGPGGQSAGAGIGLHNVVSRLRLYYGRPDVFTIMGNPEGPGTTVRLLIPEKQQRPELGG